MAQHSNMNQELKEYLRNAQHIAARFLSETTSGRNEKTKRTRITPHPSRDTSKDVFFGQSHYNCASTSTTIKLEKQAECASRNVL